MPAAVPPATSDSVAPKAVRVVGAGNGVEGSARGRINAAVLEQYRTADR